MKESKEIDVVADTQENGRDLSCKDSELVCIYLNFSELSEFSGRNT